ncbi:MAG TPA: alpha/beta hydrolase [Myxococcota bacterium]|nr:alpha/beta hydrolase [Myxococcota bacterium]
MSPKPAHRRSLLERLGRWNLKRLGATSSWFEVGETALHVYRFPRHPEAAAAAPPLILMHGVGSSAATFAKLVQHLRPHLGPIALPEAPAHGESQVPPELSPDALFASLAALFDAEPAPFILYGNSLGGGAALRYAIERPDKVLALILLSPAGANAAEQELAELVATFRFVKKGDAGRFVKRLFHRPRWYHALAGNELARRFASPPLREFFAKVGADDLLDGREVAALTMPILFMWGGAEKLLPAAHLAWFKRHLPHHAVVVEPPHFGHSAYVEHSAEVARLMLDFLVEHNLSSSSAPHP